MKEAKLPKKESEKISRAFSLMFNRASMYQMDHPFTVQSVENVYEMMTDGLDVISPIVIGYHKDRFFIEEEPFDSKLNVSRMIAHFKKTGIQSISFEKGMKQIELNHFVGLFANSNNYKDAKSLEKALTQRMVSNVKVNHVMYKKVNADDVIVNKDKLDDVSNDNPSNPSSKMYGDVVNMMAESIIQEEFAKSITLEALLHDPGKVSKDLIDQDLSLAQSGQASQNDESVQGGKSGEAGQATQKGPAAQGGQTGGGGPVAQGEGPTQGSQAAQSGGPAQGGQTGQAGSAAQGEGPAQGGQAAQSGGPAQGGQTGQAGSAAQGEGPAQGGQAPQHGGPVQGGQTGQAEQAAKNGQSVQGGQPAPIGQPAQGGQVVQNGQMNSTSPGFVIADQLGKIKAEVNNFSGSTDEVSLAELSEAIFDMKKQLIEGIEAQKSQGVVYENEKQIIDEANALTDQVLIQLVKEEYRKGEVSIPRLSQIIRRLVPEPTELQRLLPKLSKELLEEGMSRTDFLQLVKHLGKELKNENLMDSIKAGAEEIGVTSEDLIEEFKLDPSGAAELIHLASEIRQGTGDKQVLTDLLVEYIERMGSQIALDNANGDAPDNHLKSVITNVNSEIVQKLRGKEIDEDVLAGVEKRLTERMQSCFNKLMEDFERQHAVADTKEDMGNTTIFKVLEESVEDGEEFHNILKQIRSTIQENGIDENDFQQIYSEISKYTQEKQKEEVAKNLPNSILDYKNTRLIIAKEISRSLRYDTGFSTITFSVEKIIPQKPVPPGTISGRDIHASLMGELISILRQPDIVGILTKKIIIAVLPMTEDEDAKIAMKRVVNAMQAKEFIIKDIPIKAQFAGVTSMFDHEQTLDLESFLKKVENAHNDYLIRLKNVQQLF